MPKEKTLKEKTIAAKKTRNPNDITIWESTTRMLDFHIR
jgi:hypothetical protein